MQLLLNTIMLEPNRWQRERGLTQPLSALLPALRDGGFRALEIWQHHVGDLTDGALAELAAQLAAAGLAAPVVGAYPVFHLDGAAAVAAATQLDRVVVVAVRLGAQTLKIFPGRVASAALDRAARAGAVECLRRLADRLATHGLQLTMETHANTLCDTQASTEQLLRDLGAHPNVGLCFQPHMEQDTTAALAMYDALRPAVRHVHLQNRRRTDGVCTRLADGDWIDYRRLLPHLRRSGFDGPLGLEFTAGVTAATEMPPAVDQVLTNAAADYTFVRACWGA